MNYRVIYRRIAQKEFDDAVDYYEQRRPGLGDRFADAVHDAMQRITQNPLAHAVAHRDIRKTIVFKFPYVIYYRIVGSDIVVIAVFHAKRNPKIWKARK